MTAIEQGCIDIWIDEIVPCLKDTVTGDIKETVVFKIESRTYLKNFRKPMAGTLTGMKYQRMLKYMPLH